ncbi:hypothetical protein [Nannocystis pusilla]|uniref:hypothetical protein n=1 Tax=Nannocystis pusilla TaxID=889268 RepID=UPI003DA5D138
MRGRAEPGILCWLGGGQRFGLERVEGEGQGVLSPRREVGRSGLVQYGKIDRGLRRGMAGAADVGLTGERGGVDDRERLGGLLLGAGEDRGGAGGVGCGEGREFGRVELDRQRVLGDRDVREGVRGRCGEGRRVVRVEHERGGVVELEGVERGEGVVELAGREGTARRRLRLFGDRTLRFAAARRRVEELEVGQLDGVGAGRRGGGGQRGRGLGERSVVDGDDKLGRGRGGGEIGRIEGAVP